MQQTIKAFIFRQVCRYISEDELRTHCYSDDA